jgi:hypothetical protein
MAQFKTFGKSDTKNSNFAKILTFGLCLLEIWALKIEKCPKSEKMDQNAMFDYFLFLGY